MKRTLLFAASATAALVAGAAQAQSSREVSEVVVTAAPYAVSLDSATTSVDILRREDLDQAAPGGIGDVLSGMAGVRSTFFGPGASRPVIRGLSGPRVLVLSNGLGQVDASALSPDHAVATDPQEAERIEVLRGPAALAYGGSAIGGVVNIIDGRIPTTRAEGVTGRVLGSASSVDDGWSAGGALKAGSGPFVVTLDATRRESDDYDVPTFPESRRQIEADGETWPGPVHSTVENTFTELTAYGAGLSWVGENGYLGGSVKRTETRYGVPGHAHEGEEDEAEEGGVAIDLEQTRYDLRGEAEFNIGPFERIRFAGGYAEYEHVELEAGEVATRFASDGWEGRLELIQPDRNGWQGAVGLQGLMRDFKAQGEEAFVPSTDSREVAAFVLQRYDRERWGVEGGLRLDRVEIEGPTLKRAFTGVSASAGAFVRPAEGWFFGLSTSRSERAPAQEELFAGGPHPATAAFEQGDPGLESEVSYAVDFSTHYRGGGWTLDSHLFWVRYEGFIDLRPTGIEDPDSGLPINQFVQTDARFYGGEIEASYRIWEDAGRSFRLEGSADYVRGKTDLGPPARIPPWSVTGRGLVEWPRWTGMLEARRVARQNRTAGAELPTEGYTLLNASLTVRPFADEDVRLFVEGRNLTDTEAREHASFLKEIAPLPGRNVRFGVAYRF